MDFAHSYLRQVFSKETLDKIKKFNPDINYLYLMSVANGAIRPAGESYRGALSNGELHDNGHIALNNFLKDTNGFLVFQEQIIQFLNEFCGYSMGEADIIRRGFAKKTGTEQYIPEMKAGFIKTMQKNYGMCEKESESLIDNFLRVIEDASDYLFSLNHSLPYSMIGYMCGWLRHYYPLEFMATVLEINADNQDKTMAAYDYINHFSSINVKPAKFRYSTSNYTVDKSTNTIYKSVSSIKHLNKNTADELYLLRNNKYNTFYDLLTDIKENTSVGKAQLIILAKLNFFSEFGNNGKLLAYMNIFDELYNAKQLSMAKASKLNLPTHILEKYSRQTAKTYMDFDYASVLKELWNTIENTKLPIKEQIQIEMEYLGYSEYTEPMADDSLYIVTQFKTYNNKNRPYVTIRQLNSGVDTRTKVVNSGYYGRNPFKLYSIIEVDEFKSQFKSRKTDKTESGWEKTNEIEYVLDEWQVF